MDPMLDTVDQIPIPSAADAKAAMKSSRQLSQLLRRKKKQSIRVRIQTGNTMDESVVIPRPAFALLRDILAEMSKGNAVTLIPTDADLSTQQAADILNVSRPFLIGQLEKGAIPYRMVGTHRRVKFKDLAAHKRTLARNRFAALDKLSALDQKLGLY